MIAPNTSRIAHVYPFEVKCIAQSRPAKVMLNQCRAIDKTRLLKKVGEVDAEIMKAMEEAIKLVFAIS